MAFHQRQDVGRTLRATDGRTYRVTQILACRQTREGEAECLVHKLGWRKFVGRSFDKLPKDKFRHCRSKFFCEKGAQK
jgi:hypothetical protein